MSDNKQNYRRAKPIYMGLRRKPDGNLQNLVNDNDRKFGKQAEKALTPFITQRYNMYYDFTRTSSGDGFDYFPRLSEILGNHVYGDYRLNMVDGNAIYQFMHRNYPYARRGRVFGISPMGAPLSLAPPQPIDPRDIAGFDPQLHLERGQSNSEGRPGLMGASQNNNGEFLPTTAELFTRLINQRDPSSIFFLPSIGTGIMSFASLTNEWPTAIQQYFAGHQSDDNKRGRIPELFNRLLVNTDNDDDNKLRMGSSPLGRAPWFEDVSLGSDSSLFMRIAGIAYGANAIPGEVSGEEVNLFFVSWASSILDSPDFNALPDNGTIAQQLAQVAIQATFNSRNDLLTQNEVNAFGFSGGAGNIPSRNRYQNQGMNFRGATLEFMQIMRLELFADAMTTDLGKKVLLNQDRYFYRILFEDEEILGGDGNPFNHGVTGNPDIDEWRLNNGYIDGELAYDVDGEWEITAEVGGRYTVAQMGSPLEENEEGDVVGVNTDEDQLYQLMGLRPQDFRFVDGEDDDNEEEKVDFSVGGFNPTLVTLSRIMLDAYFEMESYLALALNSTKIAFNKYSKEYNENNPAILDGSEGFYTTKGKGKSPIAEFLAQERATIMGGLAATFLAMAGDKNYRDLYEGELNLKEVKWYSDYIAAQLLQARPIEEQRSVLAEMRAEPLPAPAGVASVQLVGPSTVLRQLDVPTLRLIMGEYFSQFYQTLAAVAQELDNSPKKKNQKKKKKKGKKLNVQMWETVEATLVTMLSLEGVNPAEYWRQTFAAVEQSRGSDASRLVLPPSWAGRVFRADLERDAFLTGQTPDIPKNTELFRNYVSFLRATYATDYPLIGRLLGAFQRTAAQQIKDIEELRAFFASRLQNDEKFRLRGRSVPAYRLFIYICRGVLSIPAYEVAASMVEARAAEQQALNAMELIGGTPVGANMEAITAEELRPPARPQKPVPLPKPNPSLLRPDRGA